MKLWGGRFEKATDGLVDDFHSSISFDKRLFEQDITGSIAHATMDRGGPEGHPGGRAGRKDRMDG